MMVKGFIFFRDGKMPFVIENYRMELFTDDSLLDDFCKEYNFKENYILHGQCFDIGIRGRKATFLVENSMGSTCYLRCYIINMFDKDEEYDSIGLQSPSLDEVFRYEYEYIDMVRAGINLAVEPKVVYKVPFGMNDQKYELEFRIGHDNRLGLLEDLDRKGELILPLHTNEIQECYDITNTSIEAFLNLDYAQFIAVKDFLHPEAQYSTEHGVKGEEYDNVIFVISKGWNQYQFETYAPMITKKAVIPSGKQASFERNRNLFYVCCSRPKKRLIFFVTVPIDSTFKSFLVELVGEQNIFTFSQYIERKID